MYQAALTNFVETMGTGDPPLALRLLAFNLLFFAMFAFRQARGRRPLSASARHMVGLALVGINCAIALSMDVAPLTQLARL